jgi:hypothetical protein
MINEAGLGSKSIQTSLLFESKIRDFDKIFKDKLKFKLGKLKQDTTLSDDKKVLQLQMSINKYFDNIVNRLNTYYSPLFKNISDKVNNYNYPDLLNFIDGLEMRLYENLMDKLSKDKTVKLEDIGFSEKSLFDNLNKLFLNIFAKVTENSVKREEELKENNSSMKNVYNKYKGERDTPENLVLLKQDVLKFLPESLKNSLETVKTNAESLKEEYSDTNKLKTLL